MLVVGVGSLKRRLASAMRSWFNVLAVAIRLQIGDIKFRRGSVVRKGISGSKGAGVGGQTHECDVVGTDCLVNVDEEGKWFAGLRCSS